VKVLHVINSLKAGGAEKLIEDLLPRMNGRDGIQIDALLLTDEGNVFGKSLIEAGIPIYVVPLKSVYNPLNIIYLRRHILKHKYDMIHVHLFPASYWVAMAKRSILAWKPKLVLTEHSTHNKRREKWYLRGLEKFVYSTYDRVISVSKQAQENLIRWLNPTDKSKFLVIENGVDIEKFAQAEPYKKSEICDSFSDDTKLICMVGRFTEAKDQATLIKAMTKIPDNVHLLLVGEGPLKEENKALSKEIGVKDKVHFLGFRNDIPRILKTIDIFVLSSNWEGLPLALVEGMAAGKPVIGSNALGIKEVLTGAGLLFPVGNSDELARKINELVCEKSKYEETSRKCQERASNYSLERMVERYVSVYTELLKTR